MVAKPSIYTIHSSLGDLPLLNCSLSSATEMITRMSTSRQGASVGFVNVHTWTEAQIQPNFKKLLTTFSFLMPDGVPLRWLSVLSRKPLAQRLSGPDFMNAFLRSHPEISYGFIGGSDESIQRIVQLYSLSQTSSYSPPFREFSSKNALEDWNCLLKSSKNQTPQVVWVGLGAPKQEAWIAEVSRQAPDVIFLGVGAAFDFLSGKKSRAPRWMHNLGLEWFYRLLSEPRRLFWRYLKTNSLFCYYALREILK